MSETVWKGEKVPTAKLTAEKVKEIRLKYEKDGYTQRELAEEYGVCKQTIKDVVQYVSWKHVK